jgi:hypothetical protein
MSPKWLEVACKYQYSNKITVANNKNNNTRTVEVDFFYRLLDSGTMIHFAAGGAKRSPTEYKYIRYYNHYTLVEGEAVWIANNKYLTHKWVVNTARYIPMGCTGYTTNKNAYILVKINSL